MENPSTNNEAPATVRPTVPDRPPPDCALMPDTKDTYPGSSGSVHGAVNDTKPATNASEERANSSTVTLAPTLG
ncbi:hypothetical protein GCM10010530_66900 [Kribbella aluminosa]